MEVPVYPGTLWELLALNLERFLRGEPLLNEVPWTDLDAR